MPDSGHRSAATLGRLAFRLTIVLILSTLWSGGSLARAASVLCLLFASAVLWTAYATGERPTGPGLNRWHEGAFLAILGLVLFFWFGRDLADRRSSVEASDCWKSIAAIETSMWLVGLHPVRMPRSSKARIDRQTSDRHWALGATA
jgi:hypothetical protein